MLNSPKSPASRASRFIRKGSSRSSCISIPVLLILLMILVFSGAIITMTLHLDQLKVNPNQSNFRNIFRTNGQDPMSVFKYDKYGTLTLGDRIDFLNFYRIPRPKMRKFIPKQRWHETQDTDSSCPQIPNRDYNEFPIIVSSSQIVPAKVFPNGQVAGFYNRDKKEFLPCPVPCKYQNVGNKYTDVKILSNPFSGLVQVQRECPLQKLGVFSMESEVYYPKLTLTDSLFEKFDIVSTTRLDSDVPAMYGDWWEYDFYAPVVQKTANALAVAVISNCQARNNRIEFLDQLIKAGLTVDSFGRCRNNKAFPKLENRAQERGWGASKVEVLKPYKFYLSFENSNVTDYVTEKFFQALVAGAVPVVYGVPNIKDFAPSPHSYIDSNDFPSAEALVKHLQYLDDHDEEYYKYLSWKREGVSSQFEELLASTTDIHVACRICIYTKKLFDIELGSSDEELHFGVPLFNESRNVRENSSA